jgi:hypothetical protein
MTSYVILRATGNNYGGEQHPEFYLASKAPVEAASAEHARRKFADELPDADLDTGVELFAVPARNWSSETYKAETKRRVVKV